MERGRAPGSPTKAAAETKNYSLGRLSGLGLKVWGLGFLGVECLGFRTFGLRVCAVALRVHSLGFRVRSFGIRVYV